MYKQVSEILVKKMKQWVWYVELKCVSYVITNTDTAYWIDLSFTMQKAEPQGKQFYGSQMRESIVAVMEGMSTHCKFKLAQLSAYHFTRHCQEHASCI